MLCDNILANLNILRLLIDRLHTDVKLSIILKLFTLWYPFQAIRTIFIDRVPYKHKNWQLHGLLQISVQISMLSPHMQKVAFSA